MLVLFLVSVGAHLAEKEARNCTQYDVGAHLAEKLAPNWPQEASKLFRLLVR